MSSIDLAGHLVAYWLQLALVLSLALWITRRVRRWPAERMRQLRLTVALIVLLPVIQLGVTVLDSPTATLAVEGLSIDVTELGARAVAPATGPGLKTALALLAGVAIWRLGRLGLGFVALRRWVAGATPLDLDALLDGDREGLPSAACFESAKVRSPVTFGWRRPVVLLPPAVAALPREARKAVVVHELFHIRRRDWLSVVAEESLRAVLWFQPLVGKVLDDLALVREQLVDGLVVDRLGRRRAYLDALLSFTTSPFTTAPSTPHVAVSMLHRPHHLLARVDHLTQETPMFQRSHRSLVALVLFAALAAVLVPMTSFAHTPDEAAVYHVEGDVQEPIRIGGDNPQYTAEARSDRIQGTVVVKAVIGKDGRVESTEILESLRDDLDRAASDAISTWTFRPATLDGEAVSVFYHLTVNFRLPSADSEEASADGSTR